MWTSFEYGLSAVAVAVISANIIAGYFALRRYKKSRLRREFREIISNKLQEADPLAAERSLAKIVYDAGQGQISKLYEISLDKYIIDYIVDINFKPSYYNILLTKLSDATDAVMQNEQEVFAAIQEWHKFDATYAGSVRDVLAIEAMQHNSARKVEEFIESRGNYYEDKKNLFVDEILDATRKAIDGARKTYAGA